MLPAGHRSFEYDSSMTLQRQLGLGLQQHKVMVLNCILILTLLDELNKLFLDLLLARLLLLIALRSCRSVTISLSAFSATPCACKQVLLLASS